VIYGRISGETARTLGPLLDAGADVKLIEFALAYPDGRIDTFAPKGRSAMGAGP
jgi:hypothetical protein